MLGIAIFYYLILPIITLILEILPYGAVLNFMRPASSEDGSPGHFRELYSYFDLTPFGWANFAPLFTGIITCIILLLLVVYCITGKTRLAIMAKNILYVCAVFSLGPLVLGFHFLSVVGVLITLCLIGEILLLRHLLKGTNDSRETQN